MDPRTTLLTALPLVLIITVLAAIVVFSGNTSFDIRPKASAPVPTYERVNPYASPVQIQTEIVCSDLYQPVCDQNGVTYENLCEAQKQKAVIAYYTACVESTPSSSLRELPNTQ